MLHFWFHLIHLHNNNVGVHPVFPKPLDTLPSVFLDGILEFDLLFLVPVIIKRLQKLETIFISLN